MTASGIEELKSKRCVPCEGGVPRIEGSEAEKLLNGLSGWSLVDDGKAIERKWTVKNFVAGMEFLNRVAELAEEEQHHPDVHLTGYRKVKIELSTHAIGGLSENDFILAAKINDLPIAEKS
ncbi:4a-hydroxytetrahydrobiopterin dehydratase [Planctomicrobium sp. SH661]|uniref:4a-hydroxytetrahydrobiopterin dehydratase n=1 Tax=Planctomicrobium sp. SH661 TaxID=3448124 RepID=UPI003F5BF4D1